jgi:aminopeptidase N
LGATATSTEEKLRYFSAMASAEDPKLIAQTVAFASSGVIPNGRVAQTIAMAARNSDNPEEVWRDVQPQQKAIRAHLTDDSQTFLLPAAAYFSNSTAVARGLMSDPYSKSSPGAKIIAKRAADWILTQAELQQRAVPALTAWLAGKK